MNGLNRDTIFHHLLSHRHVNIQTFPLSRICGRIYTSPTPGPEACKTGQGQAKQGKSSPETYTIVTEPTICPPQGLANRFRVVPVRKGTEVIVNGAILLEWC
jgi:hypothetical protein